MATHLSVQERSCTLSVSFSTPPPEFCAFIEFILLSLLVLAIFWQHLDNLREGSQPEERQKQKLVGRLEEERPGVQPTSQPGGLSYSRRSVVSQPIFDKQMNSATEPHSTQFCLGRAKTCVFLKFQRAFQL